MRRGSKPAKARVNAKAPGSRRPPKNESSRVQDLERRLVEARDQQTATSEILRLISHSPADPQPIFQGILSRAVRLAGADFASIFEVRGGQLHLVTSVAPTPTWATMAAAAFPASLDGDAAWAARTLARGQVRFIEDALVVPLEATRRLARAQGFRSVLIVPLLRQGQGVGLINLGWAEVRPYPEGLVPLLEAFADQAVIAIENARLFNESQEKNRALTEAYTQVTEALEQQTATAEILSVISGSPTDIQPVLGAITSRVVRLCDAFFSTVWRYDGTLIHHAADNYPTAAMRAILTRGYPAPPQRESAVAQAIGQCRIIHLEDLLNESTPAASRGVAIALGYRTLLCVPMLRDGVPIGAIAVARREQRPFSHRQIELVKTFADQAVIAIENIRLFNETKEALDQQTATAEILRVIASSPTDLQPVLDAMAESAARLCVGYDAGIFRLDGDSLRSVAHHGPIPLSPGLVIPVSRGTVNGRAALDRQTVQVGDLQAEVEEFPEGSTHARESGYRTILVVPLLREGVVIGTIVLRRAEVHSFTDKQIALLQTFADQAVIAIENARLFKELEARNRALTELLEQQTATAEILRVISRSPADVQPVFDAIAERAVRLCDGLFSGVFRFDGERMHIASSYNWTPDARERLERMYPMRPSREQISGRAVLTRSVVHVKDLQDDPDYPRSLAAAGGWRSAISVPMLRDGSPIGAINVIRRESLPFSDREIKLLQTFADQAVIAVENVRLFKELEARNRDLTETLDRQTATAELLRVVSQSRIVLQPVFDAIAASARRLCRAAFAGVFTYDGAMVHLAALDNFNPEGADEIRRAFPAPAGKTGASTRAISSGVPVMIPDVEQDPEYQLIGVAAATGFRSLLSVPMVREGRPIGTITVARAEAGAFDDSQVELLETFADQAVIAIENARLLSELETRNLDLTESLERQTATAEILRAISEAGGDAQPVFEAIAENALRLLRGFSVVVVRVDGDRLDLVASRGGAPGGEAAVREALARMPRERGMYLWDAVLDGELQQIADVEVEPVHPLIRASARARGWRANLAVPMLQEGEPIGVIAVSREAPGRFSPQQVELLKTFADQAVIAVKNASLLTDLQSRTDELTRSVEQLTALGEVGQAVSSSLDLETVLTTIVSRAVALTGVDDGVVFEYDEAAEEFTYRAATETESVVAQARRLARIRKGEGVLGRTAVTGEPAQVADITRAGAYESRLRETLLDSGVRALLAVPMLREGRLLGGIVLSRNRPGEFPPATVALLRTFATQSALAIQNARLYRELAEQGRQLEVASRHKSEFLASMSHELRTPLNGILGFNEMILGEIYGEVPSEIREPLTEMQASGRQLLRLINNVLDLSKIEAGRMELALADYMVPDVVEQVRASLQPLAADKGLEFVAAVPADLPLAHGDAGRIVQCLTNLAGNAIKFTREGRVEIAAELRGETLVYRVSDTGIGIAPDRIETLFTEFRQADPTIASEFGGSGLGLSITRKFAEMHGGRVWVESEPGQGSRFFLAVPLRATGGAPA